MPTACTATTRAPRADDGAEGGGNRGSDRGRVVATLEEQREPPPRRREVDDVDGGGRRRIGRPARVDDTGEAAIHALACDGCASGATMVTTATERGRDNGR